MPKNLKSKTKPKMDGGGQITPAMQQSYNAYQKAVLSDPEYNPETINHSQDMQRRVAQQVGFDYDTLPQYQADIANRSVSNPSGVNVRLPQTSKTDGWNGSLTSHEGYNQFVYNKPGSAPLDMGASPLSKEEMNNYFHPAKAPSSEWMSNDQGIPMPMASNTVSNIASPAVAQPHATQNKDSFYLPGSEDYSVDSVREAKNGGDTGTNMNGGYFVDGGGVPDFGLSAIEYLKSLRGPQLKDGGTTDFATYLKNGGLIKKSLGGADDENPIPGATNVAGPSAISPITNTVAGNTDQNQNSQSTMSQVYSPVSNAGPQINTNINTGVQYGDDKLPSASPIPGGSKAQNPNWGALAGNIIDDSYLVGNYFAGQSRQKEFNGQEGAQGLTDERFAGQKLNTAGSKGDYFFNTGVQVGNMTPFKSNTTYGKMGGLTTYQEGGSYSVDDTEIKRLQSLGYKIAVE